MVSVSIKNILEKLNAYTKVLIEGSVGACVSRSQYEVTASHVLAQAVEEGKGDLALILQYFKVDPGLFRIALQNDLKDLKTGNTGKPMFSPLLLNALELAWVESSLNLHYNQIRTGAIVLALRKNPGPCGQGVQDQLKLIQPEILVEKFDEIVAASQEQQQTGTTAKTAAGAGPAEGSALDRFTIDFVGMARDGKIDPIFGRDDEIRQTIDILSRRRKNNPIMVGEAGVGKTAVVEGLALKIAEGQVPDVLKNVHLRSLDMGLLSAGAGVRGEFENRLKGVIKEVKESETPIILFIDEAHTMIGAGGEAGQNDAANLLKPELARGDMKCLAATTFTEFRKYFEKDPAIARRFQMVRIEEPGPDTAAVMLRGLRGRYEKFHNVKITSSGVKAACELSNKYIPGRQLPDKAVDLLDTSAARVKMGLTIKPADLQRLEARVSNLTTEVQALEEDKASGVLENEALLNQVKELLSDAESETAGITEQWEKELARVAEIHALRNKIIQSQNGEQAEALSVEELGKAKAELQEKLNALEEMQGENPLVHPHVSPSVVAQVISEWTGVPAGNMMSDEAAVLLELEKHVNQVVKGQSWGISEMADAIRSSRTGLRNPEAPLGVFLLTGPSGVGKTETALTIADLLFGGRESVMTINMSEYQDAMSVTQLKGASAGYVGYGEGGVLTEGVRRNPYAVVVLDEVEKAHKDVLNMFYQVFDKGILRDGEGRNISFRNAVIVMTSNMGADTIMQLAMSAEAYSYEAYKQAVLPELTAHFQPALLARCTPLPFMPLGRDVIEEIIRLKLDKVGGRLLEKHRLQFGYSDQVVTTIADNCTVVQSGARNADTVISQRMLPEISRRLLINVAEDSADTHLYVALKAPGEFDYCFSRGEFDMPEPIEIPQPEPVPESGAAEPEKTKTEDNEDK